MTGVNAELEHILKSKYAPTPRATFFLPSGYQRAWREILAAEPNVQVLTGARAVGVRRGKRMATPRVTGVTVEVMPGVTFDVTGDITIDCTGSGIVSELAGCAIMYGREAKSQFNEGRAPDEADKLVQACTWMFFIQGTPGAERSGRADWRPRAVHVNQGIPFPDPERDPPPARVLPGEADPELYLQWGGGSEGIQGYDPRDPLSLAQAHADAYCTLEPEFRELEENGYTVHLAPRIGVRECRRVVGEHIMTEPEITSETFPDDTIAVGEYGIDIWPKAEQKKAAARSHDEATSQWPWRYGIPYRSLVPRDVDGLLVAGKCMSGTHIAQSSFRVMPIAGSTGQAAGVAAALAVKHRRQARDLEPQEIRKLLQSKEQHLQLSFDEP
jgi:hypothetical protein